MPSLRKRNGIHRNFPLAAFLGFFLIVAGCGQAPSNGAGKPAVVAAAEEYQSQAYLFDQSAAWTDLTKQCSFGTRDPVKPGHERCLTYILQQLKPVCDQVTTQNFVFADKSRNVTLHLSNVFGAVNPAGKPCVMLSAHWDSRPTADNDLDLANRDKPIMGADDGASGVAVLLELARVLHRERPKCCILLAFWDGEDWGPGENKMYLGSVYFAQHPDPMKPDQSILLDMIGQKGLVVDREAWSQEHFPQLDDAVWAAAAYAGESSVFPDQTGQEIIDDQIPLAKLGIPSIDLIDFDYAYWHTLQDTPDKCDPSALGAVGKTLEQYIRTLGTQSKTS